MVLWQYKTLKSYPIMFLLFISVTTIKYFTEDDVFGVHWIKENTKTGWGLAQFRIEFIVQPAGAFTCQ